MGIEELQSQVTEARQTIAQARQQSKKAEEQVQTAEGQMSSQRVIRSQGGIGGLRARQKVTGQIADVKKVLSEREQKIQEYEKQVQTVESAIAEAQAQESAYNTAKKAFYGANPTFKIAVAEGKEGKLAQEYYQDLQAGTDVEQRLKTANESITSGVSTDVALQEAFKGSDVYLPNLKKKLKFTEVSRDQNDITKGINDIDINIPDVSTIQREQKAQALTQSVISSITLGDIARNIPVVRKAFIVPPAIDKLSEKIANKLPEGVKERITRYGISKIEVEKPIELSEQQLANIRSIAYQKVNNQIVTGKIDEIKPFKEVTPIDLVQSFKSSLINRGVNAMSISRLTPIKSALSTPQAQKIKSTIISKGREVIGVAGNYPQIFFTPQRTETYNRLASESAFNIIAPANVRQIYLEKKQYENLAQNLQKEYENTEKQFKAGRITKEERDIRLSETIYKTQALNEQYTTPAQSFYTNINSPETLRRYQEGYSAFISKGLSKGMDLLNAPTEITQRGTGFYNPSENLFYAPKVYVPSQYYKNVPEQLRDYQIKIVSDYYGKKAGSIVRTGEGLIGSAGMSASSGIAYLSPLGYATLADTGLTGVEQIKQGQYLEGAKSLGTTALMGGLMASGTYFATPSKGAGQLSFFKSAGGKILGAGSIIGFSALTTGEAKSQGATTGQAIASGIGMASPFVIRPVITRYTPEGTIREKEAGDITFRKVIVPKEERAKAGEIKLEETMYELRDKTGRNILGTAKFSAEEVTAMGGKGSVFIPQWKLDLAKITGGRYIPRPDFIGNPRGGSMTVSKVIGYNVESPRGEGFPLSSYKGEAKLTPRVKSKTFTYTRAEALKGRSRVVRFLEGQGYTPNQARQQVRFFAPEYIKSKLSGKASETVNPNYPTQVDIKGKQTNIPQKKETSGKGFGLGFTFDTKVTTSGKTTNYGIRESLIKQGKTKALGDQGLLEPSLYIGTRKITPLEGSGKTKQVQVTYGEQPKEVLKQAIDVSGAKAQLYLSNKKVTQSVPFERIVRNDIFTRLEGATQGKNLPAKETIIDTKKVRVNEKVLTGESWDIKVNEAIIEQAGLYRQKEKVNQIAIYRPLEKSGKIGSNAFVSSSESNIFTSMPFKKIVQMEEKMPISNTYKSEGVVRRDIFERLQGAVEGKNLPAKEVKGYWVENIPTKEVRVFKIVKGQEQMANPIAMDETFTEGYKQVASRVVEKLPSIKRTEPFEVPTTKPTSITYIDPVSRKVITRKLYKNLFEVSKAEPSKIMRIIPEQQKPSEPTPSKFGRSVTDVLREAQSTPTQSKPSVIESPTYVGGEKPFSNINVVTQNQLRFDTLPTPQPLSKALSIKLGVSTPKITNAPFIEVAKPEMSRMFEINKPISTMSNVPATMLEPQIKTVLNPKLEAKPEIKLEPSLKPVIEPRVNLQPKIELKLSPEIKLEPQLQPKLQPKLEPKIELKIQPQVRPKAQPKPSPKPRPSTRIGKPSNISESKLFGTPSRVKEAFEVVTFKGGKEITLAKGLPKGRAEKLGSETVLRTARASYKLKPSGTTTMEDISFKPSSNLFRPSKKEAGRVVQIKNTRLSGKSEVREVIKSRKKGGKLKIW